MSYLSRRMREDRRWARPKPGHVKFTVTADTTQARRVLAEACREIDVLRDPRQPMRPEIEALLQQPIRYTGRGA